jgi:branched-chain amino acid transport system ATP-binding protein
MGERLRGVDMALLETQGLGKLYGKLQAVKDLDFTVEEGELRGLIGPNGAGKTTVFNMLTGFDPPSAGRIYFRGEDITGLPAHKIAHKGIARAFQQSYLFMDQTVIQNVLVGCHMSCRAGAIREFLHTPRARQHERAARDKAAHIIDFMGMTGLTNEFAGNLSHGQQRALGVGMALACDPTLLLLDEPVTGMNPTESAEMVERINKIRQSGVTIVLVEHSMEVVMNVCDLITVVSYGEKLAEGTPQEIRNDCNVIEAYLGKEEA